MNEFVYDIEEAGLGRPGTLKPHIEKNRRILGKAVHPNALRRLHELWPNAVVRVLHGEEFPGQVRGTTVRIYERPGVPGGPVYGVAICHPNDQWDRRRGIELAFRRALAQVRECAQEAENA